MSSQSYRISFLYSNKLPLFFKDLGDSLWKKQARNDVLTKTQTGSLSWPEQLTHQLQAYKAYTFSYAVQTCSGQENICSLLHFSSSEALIST